MCDGNEARRHSAENSKSLILCAICLFFNLFIKMRGCEMVEIVTSAQMRAVERAAIDSGGVTGLDLMERAGAGAVAAMLAHWPQLDTRMTQVVILCGPGNNGGDGYVMARHLQARGWRPWVLSFGEVAELPPDARAMAAQWSIMGQILPFGDVALQQIATDLDPARPLLLVDALFGIGLSRPLGAAITRPWAAFMARVTSPCWALAVDVPSGVSDQMPAGERLQGFNMPEIPRLTVTFHALKLAHGNMIATAEAVHIVDIGLRA